MNLNISLSLILMAALASSCAESQGQGQNSGSKSASTQNNSAMNKMDCGDLDPEVYRITQLKETERPFTGKYWNHKEDGTYKCAVCHEPLFASDTKYESGSGWPSFYAPLEQGKVGTKTDRSFGMVRTEIHCKKCGAHLGHVFNDGPKPTGERYCVNSASLDFEPIGPPRP